MPLESDQTDATLRKPCAGEAEASIAAAHDETLVRPDDLTRRGGEALRQRLLQLLATLPEDQQSAVRLRHLERWPLETIANKLDRSPAQIAGLLRSAMQQLRGQLPER